MMRLLPLLLLVGASPSLAQGQADTATRAAVITGVTMGTVYLGAGRNDGLREGSVVRVLRLGERARYRVAFLSSRSAAARPDSLAPLPAVGDSVVFVPVREQITAVTSAHEPTAAARRRGATLRGRVGLRYLGSWDRDGGTTLRQPGFELRLDGPLGRNGPVALDVDIRSRRTSLYRPGAETATSQVMGVYQAALRIQAPGGGVSAVLGRQYAPTLAGVGMFDGLLLAWDKPRWGAGVTAGLSPELGSLRFSSDLRQAGFFVQGRSAPSRPLRWGLTLGGMGSYAGGGVNREFAFLQGTLGARYLSAVLLQELDLNRGWKLAAGEPRFSLTSSFLSVTLMPLPSLSFSGGLDSRRNVRLYRDLTTPEELFDDRFRRGYWGGGNLTIGRKLRLGGELRTGTVEGADSLRTSAASLNLSVERLTALGFGFRARGTRYTTPGHNPGTLLAGGLRLAPARFGSLELDGGARSERGHPDADRFWAGFDAEVFLRRSWFLLTTFTREWGRGGLTPTTDLLYGGVSYRF